MTYQRAVEAYVHLQLCEHEAAHAAAGMLLGLDIVEAVAGRHTLAELERDDDPTATAGHVTFQRPPGAGGLRKSAITTIMGRLEEGAPNWPPPWPLNSHPEPGDPTLLTDVVNELDLDRGGYSHLVQDAYALATSRAYERLKTAISYGLERYGTLDRPMLARIQAIVTGGEVEHVLLKAVTTVNTDQGAFEAVISTESIDREKDIVSAAGMVTALRKWNRPIPLAWNHQTDAAAIFGHIDPATVQEVNGEVVAGGQVHLDSDVGREAWRSFKSRAIGFSFGYIIIDSTDRDGGGRHITALDVFEVTATPTPMNNDTRVLSTKAIDHDLKHVRDEYRDLMASLYGASETKAPETMRMKADRLAREHAPIQIASFEC
jgi:HK97 family phage prohead protease